MNRVLGIDPGYDRLGLAVLEGNISKPVHIWSECIEIPKGRPEERLAAVFREVSDVVKIYAPDRAAIETLFFSTNKKTALGVAEARGAVCSALGTNSIPVEEFMPVQVKNAVTGYGRADKKAVEQMVLRLVSLPAKPRRDDEFDAIAIALCGLSTYRP